MKKILYILTVLTAFWGCRPIELTPEERPVSGNPEGSASIRFSINLPEPATPASKVMSDHPGGDLDIRIAAFGSTGFLKEYVQAVPDPAQGYPDSEGNYHFTVQLALSDQTRNIHFLANGPESLPFLSEDQVISDLYSEGSQDAYWQRIRVDNGILAKSVWDPDSQSYSYVKGADGFYEVKDEVTVKFRDIKLIRNFAKIIIDCTADNFKLNDTEAFTVMNKPDKGSVAPYDVNSGQFIFDYQTKHYRDLQSYYAGFMPVSTKIGVDNDTAINDFRPKDSAIYIYERTIPTETLPPTYLLVRGTYYNTAEDRQNDVNGKDCYYKVNLMDNEGYYTIYRNFCYKITLTAVSAPGSGSAADANATGGTGNVTLGTEINKLIDVSDGNGRMYVTMTSISLPGHQNKIQVKYKFIPNVDNGEVDNEKVTIKLNEANAYGNVLADTYSAFNAGSQRLIGDSTTGVVAQDIDDDAEKWRSIYFDSTEGTEGAIKKQVISIIGRSQAGSDIYRNVEINLLEKLDLIVKCREKYISKGLSEKVVVDVSIPKNLPESMFPLLFDLESDKGTLTPDADVAGNNLPVEAGPTMIPGKTGVSFHFTRTLNYNEYLALCAGEGGLATFSSYFKTNNPESACTVYVDNIRMDADINEHTNKPFFNQGYDNFYNLYEFSDLLFDKWNVTANNQPVKFTFNTVAGARPPYIIVTLDGLKPGAGSGLTPNPGRENEHIYTPSGDSHTLNLLSDANGGIYSVKLSTAWEGAYVYKTAERSNDDVTVTLVKGANQTVTFNNGDFGNGNNQAVTKNGVTITFSNIAGHGTTAFIYSHMSIADNTSFTVEGTNYIISNVTVNYIETLTAGDFYGNMTGTGNISNGDSSIWTGESFDDLMFNLVKRNQNEIRISNIRVTYCTYSYDYILNE